MILNFYKKNGKWYADVPGHTEAENEMVEGSDLFLDYASKEKSSISIMVETTPAYWSNGAKATLFMLKHDEHGATYHIVSPDNKLNNNTLWICNVTHDVLGEHPAYIFVYWNE